MENSINNEVINCLKCGKKFTLSKKQKEELFLLGFKYDPVFCIDCINEQLSKIKTN